jgi:CheY-like chemotaxis protein
MPSPNVERLRVLVADNCRDTVNSARLLLEMWGHDAYAAYDAASALAVARQARPDVALLDLAVPGVEDGYRLAHALRPEVPLLVCVTGYADLDHRRRCDEAGFDVVLAKPFDPARLETLLTETARLLGHSRALSRRLRELVAESRGQAAELRRLLDEQQELMRQAQAHVRARP